MLRFFIVLIVSQFFAVQVASADEAVLYEPFEETEFQAPEKRILQLALALSGEHDGRVDGVWDARSMAALEDYVLNEFEDTPQNLHVANLVIAFLADMEANGWTWREFPELGMSMAVPEAILAEPEPENRGLRWWSRTGTLTLLTNSFEAELARAWHSAAEMASVDPDVLSIVRDDHLLVTSGYLEDGRSFYTRSDQVDGHWSTVYLASGPDQANMLNLIRTSISARDPQYWELPRGGHLEYIVRETLEAFDGTDEGEGFELGIPGTGFLPAEPGTDASGTAFYVNDSILVTAQHVIEGCGRISLGDGTPLTLLAHDKKLDVAALASPVRADTWLSLTDKEHTRLGQKLHAAGFPYYNIAGTSLHLTGGNVSSLADVNDDRRFFSFSAPVQPGNSGGPLIDNNGEVMGIVVSRLSERYIAEATGTLPQNINYALNREELLAFLTGHDLHPQQGLPEFSMDDGAPEGFEKAIVPVLCY